MNFLRNSLLTACFLMGGLGNGADFPVPFPQLRPTGAVAGWRQEAWLALPYGSARVRLEAAMLAEGWEMCQAVILPRNGGELILWGKSGRKILTLLRRTGPNVCRLSVGEG